jgi:hypothetical protein
VIPVSFDSFKEQDVNIALGIQNDDYRQIIFKLYNMLKINIELIFLKNNNRVLGNRILSARGGTQFMLFSPPFCDNNEITQGCCRCSD